MATRMIQRRGTAAEWSSANPVLAAGEIGFETDTQKFKFGDGTTAWADITYFASADQLIDGAPELLDTLNELAAAIGDDENFITTITTDLATKLDAAGGTISGNLIVQSDATVGGTLSTSTAPTNPVDVTNKEYVDAQVNNVSLDVDSLDNRTTATETNVADLQSRTTTVEADVTTNASDIATNLSSLTELRSDFTALPKTFVGQTTPTSADNGGNVIEAGSFWYDLTNGNIHILVDLDENNSVWVDTSGPNVIVGAEGSNINSFPIAPADEDTHEGYIYNATQSAWQVDRSISISEINEIDATNATDNSVLMYNNSTSKFEVSEGIRLDENAMVPLAHLTLVQDAILGGAPEEFNTLGEIASYLNGDLYTDVAPLTVKSAADWSTDTSTPLAGSLNVETGGAEIRIKVGNGTDNYATLSYVPSNGSVATDIATAIAPLAPKANPTFSGTVSLPSTTSIGDVSDAEIAHLDGVTSGIQGQLDDLDTLKAPIADPTFTGTVSGIDKTMVGLSNVDNTADADKPVSTATQTALDAKAALSGASFTGNVVIGGNLTVSGETVTVSASDLSVRDNMIYLNQAGLFDLAGAVGDGTNVVYTTATDHDIKVGDYITVSGANPASFDLSGDGLEVTAVTADTITVASTVTDTYVDSGSLRGKSHANPDLGWAAGRYDTVNGSGYGHAGIFRDATDGVFKFFDGYVPEPDESVFIDTSDASFALAPLAVEKMVFPDGTEQTAAAVPSLTTFTEKTASYQLDTLDHKDNIVEMNMSTAGTFTVPLDSTLAWPIGASMDIFATGTGEITIAGEAGVTLNATPGLTLRTQWSSATILKRGANNWVVYGDLKA